MRTKDPKNIRVDYATALQDIRRTFSSANSSGVVEAEKNLIAEYAFLAAATLLEGYIGDLFVAYINRDSSTFRSALVSQMIVTTKDTSDASAERAKTHAVITLPKHLTTSEIRAILDPRDYNITFKSVSDLKAKAGLWLIPASASHFTSLTRAQSSTLESVRAIRNFLAHRSGASKSAMQVTLADSDLPAPLRRGANSVRAVGSFLRSKPIGAQTIRLSLYLDELDQIALHLCP